MELKKALSIYYTRMEIRQIEEALTWMNGMQESTKATDYMNAIEYTGMPKAKGYSNSAPFEKEIIKNADKVVSMQRRLEEQKKKLMELLEEFEVFTASLENIRTRIIVRWRCIDGKTWEEIGEKMHMDRRTASRTFYKCFTRGEKMPTMPV